MNDVEIYNGKYYLKWIKKPIEVVHYKLPEKVIVLDLDETLGSFGDLYILWSGITQLHPQFTQFEPLLDLYPEFLRYGILTILEFLYEKKKTKECSKIFIYTNNRCSKEWVQNICSYFQTKIHKLQPKGDLLIPLFNTLICAFKIKNKHVEKHRTTHKKTYADLIRCATLSKDVEIGFVDDVEHEDMKNSRVYYICPKPYYHKLSCKEIIRRFVTYKWFIPKKSKLVHSIDFWAKWFRSHGRQNGSEYSQKSIDEDTAISVKMLYHIKYFLKGGNPSHDGTTHTNKLKRTKRRRGPKQNKTKRNRTHNHIHFERI